MNNYDNQDSSVPPQGYQGYQNWQSAPAPGWQGESLSPTVTKMEWLIFFLLTNLPIVNLVALIYFACDREKPSRANFARLQLILILGGLILGGLILAGLLLAGFFLPGLSLLFFSVLDKAAA